MWGKGNITQKTAARKRTAVIVRICCREAPWECEDQGGRADQLEQGIGTSTTSAPRRVRMVQTRSSCAITGASTALRPRSLR